jgi:hypothetical protein
MALWWSSVCGRGGSAISPDNHCAGGQDVEVCLPLFGDDAPHFVWGVLVVII